MAAGELWVDAASGELMYRDASNVVRGINAVLSTTLPVPDLLSTDTPGELAVRRAGPTIWWNTNFTLNGLRVRASRNTLAVGPMSGISGPEGLIFVRGDHLYYWDGSTGYLIS